MVHSVHDYMYTSAGRLITTNGTVMMFIMWRYEHMLLVEIMCILYKHQKH